MEDIVNWFYAIKESNKEHINNTKQNFSDNHDWKNIY